MHKRFTKLDLIAISEASKHLTAYGEGVYAAVDLSYSLNPTYSAMSEDGRKYVIVAKGLTGRSERVEYQSGQPDDKKQVWRRPTEGYDTTCDNEHKTIFTEISRLCRCSRSALRDYSEFFLISITIFQVRFKHMKRRGFHSRRKSNSSKDRDA